jgi:hypothetical protein
MNNQMFLLKRVSDGFIFSGLNPPRYKPDFIKPEGSYRTIIFSNLEDIMSVSKMVEEETMIVPIDPVFGDFNAN